MNSDFFEFLKPRSSNVLFDICVTMNAVVCKASSLRLTPIRLSSAYVLMWLSTLVQFPWPGCENSASAYNEQLLFNMVSSNRPKVQAP